MLTIKVLAADDWPLWREARLAALAEAPYAFGSRLTDWQGDGDREERWRQRLSLAGSYHLIALLDGVPAGMAAGVPGDEPGEAALISMWVAPEARGQRVGDTLINEIESWARAAGSARLLLLVKADNAAAIRLYERNGFAFVPDARVDGDGERPMAKELPGARMMTGTIMTQKSAIFLRPGEGERLDYLDGDVSVVLASGDATGGAFSAVETTSLRVSPDRPSIITSACATASMSWRERCPCGWRTGGRRLAQARLLASRPGWCIPSPIRATRLSAC